MTSQNQDPTEMKVSLEKRIKILFVGGLFFLGTLLGSTFVVLNLMVEIQQQTHDIIVPLNHNIANFSDKMAHFFNEQSKIATSRSLEEFHKAKGSLDIKKEINDEFHKMESHVETLLKSDLGKGSTKINKTGQKLMARMGGELEEFFKANDIYSQNIENVHTYNIKFDRNLKLLEEELDSFVKQSFSLAGKARFSFRRKVRKLRPHFDDQSPLDNETKQEAAAVLFGSEATAQRHVSDLINKILILGKYAYEVELASDLDMFNNIKSNKIDQTIVSLDRQIEKVKMIFKDNDVLRNKVSNLSSRYNQVRKHIIGNEGDHNILKLKKAMLAQASQAVKIREDSFTIGQSVGNNLIELQSFSTKLNLAFKTKSDETKRLAQLIALALGSLGLLLAFIASRRVREGIDDLKQQNNQLGDMSKEISTLLKTVELKNNELKEINHNLEHLVEERTETIRNILDNVQSGFFIVSKDLSIADGFTKSCYTILGNQFKANAKLTQVLGLTQREKENFVSGFNQVFEDIFPDDVSLGQIPERYRIGDRVIRLRGKALRDHKSNQITNILYTLNDITELERIEYENGKNLAVMKILVNKPSFVDFITETKKQLGQARDFNQNKRRMILHTIKGNAGAFGLSIVSTQIHEIEESATIEDQHLADVENLFRKFLGSQYSILEVDFDHGSSEVVQVPKDYLDDLRSHMVIQDSYSKLCQSITSWLEFFDLKEVRQIIGPIEETFGSLAARLNKKARMEVSGSNLKVHGEQCGNVLKNLIHAVRNAIDHGLEEEFERGDKPEEGVLKLSFSEDKRGYVIQLTDDGRGIDSRILVKKALENSLITEDEAKSMSEEDKLKLIFESGLSTAEVVSDISGRGVGVGALKMAIEEVEGSLNLKSELGIGTQLDIIIPFAKKPKDLAA